MKNKKKILISALAGIMAAVMLLSLLVSLVPAPVAAASSSEIKELINELKDQNDELKEEIKQLKSQIKDNMGEMERLVAEKDIIDHEIFLLNEQVVNINQQIQAYNLLIADKQDELDAAKERLQLLTDQNKDRIRAMEMYGEMSYWSVLAQAGTFGELLDRLSMVAEIARADERRLKEMSDAAQKVEDAQAVLETEKASLEVTRGELDAAQAAMVVKREEADGVLLQLIARGEEYEAMMDAAEAETEALLEDIAAAEKEYTEAKRQEYLAWLATSVPPTTTKNNYAENNDPPSNVVAGTTWIVPIQYRAFTSAYGWRIHPVYGYKKFHSGVDLAAPKGTKIVASRSGVVTEASYNSSAGYYVTINHGDGFSTTYMHMTHYTVKAGQRVDAGQKIGECGSTGVSTGPHLHFSVYYNGKSVNPANYINI